ncbi:MAG TPA: TMEM175 family protein [Candidatus Eremiobacteraceae bacterium]|nr:TMEM175 family protein [Candidatus Eremiobacteraceae bacterium]
MSKSRFEAFSDGVFAFAITLLVLGFSLPAIRLTTNHDLTAALLALWPNLIAYALSFGVIGIMWQNHHALFRQVEKVDRATIFWNLLLLAGTAFIPFATGALGNYPTMKASALLYGLTLSTTATAYNLMLNHLIKAGAFHASVTKETIASTVRAYRTGWFVYAAATLLALEFPVMSFAAYVLIAVYYLVPHGLDSDARA